MSGDGSKVFLEMSFSIKVWSVQTREFVGQVELETEEHMDPLCTDGSRIWIRCKDLSTMGWDFEVLGSPPTILSNVPSERPYLDFTHEGKHWINPCQIKVTVTGKEIFKLAGKYAEPKGVEWDGQHLAANHGGGEFLILDFGNLCSQ